MHVAEERLTLGLSLPVSRPRQAVFGKVSLQVGTGIRGKSDLFFESGAARVERRDLLPK